MFAFVSERTSDLLVYSGGGFVAGVIATVAYAKAAGYRLQKPWPRIKQKAF